MSKILKVKMRQAKTPGSTHNDYPPEYDAKKIQVVAYGGHEEVDGQHYGYCIGVVSDGDASDFLAGEDIEEIAVDDANMLGREWRPRRMTIVVPDAIINWVKNHRQQIRDFVQNNPGHWASRGLRALDPDDDEPGIQWSQLFDIEKWL